MENRTLVVKYPPEYDGELHIHTEKHFTPIGRTLKITILVNMGPDETVQETVRRIGQDMQRAR